MMIGHYLATAFAKAHKSPFTTAANIVTLALGLACFIAAYGIATYWRSGDAHHPGADRIYYIEQAFGDVPMGPLGQMAPTWSSVRLSSDLRREMPELEAVARIDAVSDDRGAIAVSTGATKLFLHSASAETEILDLFQFDFREGSAETALRGPADVVLTETAARQLFGQEPALGRSLLLSGETDVTVSGVIAPVRQPSFMGDTAQAPARFDILLNVALQGREVPSAWGAIGGTTIVKLPQSMPVEVFQTRLDDLAARAENTFDSLHLTAVPISRIVATVVDTQFLGGGPTDVSASTILLGLGALILIVACVNYANLAAAQTASRRKEGGMRRVLGAGPRHLLMQQLVETCLLTIPALCLAVFIVAVATPAFQTMLSIDPLYFLTADPEGRGVVILAAISLSATGAASAYPAYVLGRTRTAAALGSGQERSRSSAVPGMLVAVQFFSASFLIIVLAVAQLQHAHLKNAAFSRGHDPVVVLDDYRALGVDFETFQSQLMSAPQIRSVTASSVTPWTEQGGNLSVLFGPSPGQAPPMVTYLAKVVGDNYFETYGRTVVAGRALEERDAPRGSFYWRRSADETVSEPPRVVVDRRAAAALGYSDPEQAIGQTIYDYTFPTENPPASGVIIGVVESDDPALVTPFAGTYIEYDPEYQFAARVAVRVDPADVSGAIEHITRVWDELAPDIPARATLSEALFEQIYAPYHKIAAAFAILSACAFIISSMGLLAVAVHVAARRRNEIGVRKTLGATTARVLRLLIVDFSKPVIVGNLLAWPFAWMAAESYLRPFTERGPLTLLPFVLSLILTLLIAWLAVGGQAWRAAKVKPALVLKAE